MFFDFLSILCYNYRIDEMSNYTTGKGNNYEH